MQFPFIHQNFPGQFRHSAKALAQDDKYQVVAIGHFPDFQGFIPALVAKKPSHLNDLTFFL